MSLNFSLSKFYHLNIYLLKDLKKTFQILSKAFKNFEKLSSRKFQFQFQWEKCQKSLIEKSVQVQMDLNLKLDATFFQQ